LILGKTASFKNQITIRLHLRTILSSNITLSTTESAISNIQLLEFCQKHISIITSHLNISKKNASLSQETVHGNWMGVFVTETYISPHGSL